MNKEYPEILKKDKDFGRRNDPVTSAWQKGPCGDDMEFYISIEPA